MHQIESAVVDLISHVRRRRVGVDRELKKRAVWPRRQPNHPGAVGPVEGGQLAVSIGYQLPENS